VKECDRIKATRKNLVKCGVLCKELDDGLIIEGKRLQVDKTKPKKKILIKTYNDHRIAMSFSILGAYFANNGHHVELTIQNKNCVNKTFPEFWDHIHEKFGVQTAGTTEIKSSKATHSAKGPLFIIGMRYAGKSTTSKLLSEVLGLGLEDMV
jgi:pentafunctional AROM polypeptide